MPDGSDLAANAGYLVASAAVTVVVLGAYAVTVARRVRDARVRHMDRNLPAGR